MDLSGQSTMLAVLPLGSDGTWEMPQLAPGDPADFADIDPDVDVPQAFFRNLRRHTICDEPVEVTIPGSHPPAGAAASEKPDVQLIVERLEVFGVEAPDVPSHFLVATVRPRTSSDEAWLDAAKALSTTRASEPLLATVAPYGLDKPAWSTDTRPAVLVAAYLEGSQEQREGLASHFATRAPLSDELWRKPEMTGVDAISDHHCRFVTPRISGFVVEAGGQARHFQGKFLAEVRSQFLLAIVVTLWQRTWMEWILGAIQDIWQETESHSGLRRGQAVSRRLVRLRNLRNRHAVLIASGTFGPMFDSGSQAAFWDRIQRVYGVKQRRQELDEALNALAEAAEIEASVNLERLLGFFTLMIGVPSLVFAVLGVNINKVTSQTDGVSLLLILGLFVACLIVGAGAFFVASGSFAASSSRSTRRRSTGRD